MGHCLRARKGMAYVHGVRPGLMRHAPLPWHTQLSLAALRQAPCPAVSIIGNHELYNFDRAQLARQSGEGEWLKHGDKEYHSFAPADGWRVVVLDPYQLALIGHAQDGR